MAMEKHLPEIENLDLPGYRFLELIGKGALGVVYRAIQIIMNRPVAIKILKKEYTSDKEYVERFLREARAAAKLSHENIVRAIDAREYKGNYFFIMEYVDGVSLSQIVEKQKTLKESEALKYILQIAIALAHINKYKIIHRDIKPGNILITREGVAKLCDLGLAKDISYDSSLTTEGTILGTPHYISPEQAKGITDIDIRTDIYSLGGTLYYMLTGQPPFTGKTPVEVISKHLSEPLVPPKRLNPKISEATNQLVLKMMAKKRERRHQSPEELIQEIEAILKGVSLPKRQRTPTLRRVIKEKRTSLVFPAVIGVTIAIIGLIAILLVSQQKHQEHPTSPFKDQARVPKQAAKETPPVTQQPSQPESVPSPSDKKETPQLVIQKSPQEDILQEFHKAIEKENISQSIQLAQKILKDTPANKYNKTLKELCDPIMTIINSRYKNFIHEEDLDKVKNILADLGEYEKLAEGLPDVLNAISQIRQKIKDRESKIIAERISLASRTYSDFYENVKSIICARDYPDAIKSFYSLFTHQQYISFQKSCLLQNVDIGLAASHCKPEDYKFNIRRILGLIQSTKDILQSAGFSHLINQNSRQQILGENPVLLAIFDLQTLATLELALYYSIQTLEQIKEHIDKEKLSFVQPQQQITINVVYDNISFPVEINVKTKIYGGFIENKYHIIRKARPSFEDSDLLYLLKKYFQMKDKTLPAEFFYMAGLLSYYADKLPDAKSYFTEAKQKGIAEAELFLKELTHIASSDEEESARQMYKSFEKEYKAKNYQKALAIMLELKEKYSHTAFYKNKQDEIEEMVKKLQELVQEKPAQKEQFNGKVEKLAGGILKITYDFKDEKENEDWQVIGNANFKQGKLTGTAGLAGFLCHKATFEADLAIDVEFKLLKGNSVSYLLYTEPNLNKGYLAITSINMSFRGTSLKGNPIFKLPVNFSNLFDLFQKVIDRGDGSFEVKSGNTYKVRFCRQQDELSLMADNKQIASAKETSYNEGSVGFGVGDKVEVEIIKIVITGRPK